MRTWVPGGPSGVRLKSKAPCSWAWAERAGLTREPLRRLRVMRACSRSRSQSFKGKAESVLQLLESYDGAFSGVALMTAGWGKLEIDINQI